MESIVNIGRTRYSPLRITPDQTYTDLVNDVMVAMDAFRNTRMTAYLHTAKDALDALVERAKAGI